MSLPRIIILSACLFLAACAGNRTTPSSEDYVEIDNPSYTMSPDAPAKIWVPRRYVESGPPRGGEVVKKATEKVVQSFQKPEEHPVATAPQPVASLPPSHPASPVQQPAVAAVTPSQPAAKAPVAVGTSPTVRNRIALLEIGQNGLVQPLYESLRRTAIGPLIEPAQSAFLSQFATVTTQAEKGSFAKRLQQDYGANVVVYIAAPEGVMSGKALVAEVFDAMGGGLVRRFDVVIPSTAAAGQADGNAAVSAALAGVTERVKGLLELIPWYARITEVDGKRAYIAAGKEAGLVTGQVLSIYRSGKFIEGLGYAPGEKIGTLVVGGFVGPNGSFGVIREGQGVQAADVVSVE